MSKRPLVLQICTLTSYCLILLFNVELPGYYHCSGTSGRNTGNRLGLSWAKLRPRLADLATKPTYIYT